MKSKNPRHNSVRIVRRDYCFSGTCLENVAHWKTLLLSSNAKTTYHSSKHAFFKKKKQNKQKTKRPLKKLFFFSLRNYAAVTIEVPHPDNLPKCSNFQIPNISSWKFSILCFEGLWKPDVLLLTTDKMQLPCWFPVSWLFHNYFKFFSSLWNFDTSVDCSAALNLVGVKLQWQP